MAENNDSTEKTLEPTEKRLQDARRKGDVPSSKETGNMVVVIALLGITRAGSAISNTPCCRRALSTLIEQASSLTVATGDPGLTRLGQIMGDFFFTLAIAVAPLFGALLIGGLIGAAIQGETVIAFERIKPETVKNLAPRRAQTAVLGQIPLSSFSKASSKCLPLAQMALWITNQAVRAIWMTSRLYPRIPARISGECCWQTAFACCDLPRAPRDRRHPVAQVRLAPQTTDEPERTARRDQGKRRIARNSRANAPPAAAASCRSSGPLPWCRLPM